MWENAELVHWRVAGAEGGISLGKGTAVGMSPKSLGGLELTLIPLLTF